MTKMTMKKAVAALLLSVTFFTHANVMNEYEVSLEDTLNVELNGVNGEVTSMECINHFVGVVCYSTLEFVDQVQSRCEETYYYLGFGEKVYERLCSTCWFNQGEEIHRPICR
jgi:hypothetical protein